MSFTGFIHPPPRKDTEFSVMSDQARLDFRTYCIFPHLPSSSQLDLIAVNAEETIISSSTG
jgi:hypothetical protein